MVITFEISDDLYSKSIEWKQSHKLKCRIGNYPTAIEGRYTYSFTPTGIGTFIDIQCVCGEKLNLTEDVDW